MVTAHTRDPIAPQTGDAPDLRAARASLLEQIAKLEADLAGVFAAVWPRTDIALGPDGADPRGGARLLSVGELEAVRDDLVERVASARTALRERTAVEEHHRARREDMLLDPDHHRWERVTNAQIGEPGCRQWHVLPRHGLLGMLLGWWRVRISSGCPLPGTG